MMVLPAVPVAAPSSAIMCQSDLAISPEAVLRALRDRLPRTKMLNARKTPIPGITAINLANGQQVYAANGSNYLIIGVIYNLDTGRTLQARTKETAAPNVTSASGSAAMTRFNHFLHQ